MEYYETKCQECNHMWQWVGLKTGLGNPEEFRAQFERNDKCPKCGGETKTGLDHTSVGGQLMDEQVGFIIETLNEILAPSNKPDIAVPAPNDVAISTGADPSDADGEDTQ